ncbi:glycosyltransferase family 4 protein [Lysinibacillus antri]|uniref:Glycosyltransferase family 1 protein n=1 Tax=Lysinibacillus antri TaxID=2498145 RepID=A0A3S0R7N5_9BACI|nr:glycosyltransferase family 4 protein [Lysinibacillus antri]RUL55178.1 glycosyltransferase family 1 protein [Lysinibacillus antri]
MKILFVTTISNTINSFLIPHIQLLLEQGHQVDLACNIVSEINPLLIKLGCKVNPIAFQRSPLSKENYRAYKNLKKLIKREGYQIIHTHTPVASVCVRLACRNLENIRIIYTAHGFHFYNGAPYRNWLLYYPIERYLSRFTDVLITINNEDFKRAKKTFKSKRIEYVPGIGLDLMQFSNIKIDKFQKRKDLGLPEDAIVILSVGELNINKNHRTVINAIYKLKNPKIYYVICGDGEQKNNLLSLSKDLGLQDNVKLLGYRNDIPEILTIADIFVFPSLREGLPVSLMEAMAAGLPIVCSNIRGNKDLVSSYKGGFLINPTNTDEVAKYIDLLIKDKEKFHDLSPQNKEIIKKFDLSTVITRMQEIYTAVLRND